MKGLWIAGALAAATALSGCNGVTGAVAQSAASQAAGAAITGASQRNRFAGMTCAQLSGEIAGAKNQMLNPFTAVHYRGYLRDAEAAYAAKGCA